MELENRLKEFYLLETFQVGFYESQLSSMQENEYLWHAFKLLINVEKAHVEFFHQQIQKYGGDVPVITRGFLSLAGVVVGESTDLISNENRYEIARKFETRAIEMYRAFILETWEEPDLNAALWQFMIEEELHLLWFKKL